MKPSASSRECIASRMGRHQAICFPDTPTRKKPRGKRPAKRRRNQFLASSSSSSSSSSLISPAFVEAVARLSATHRLQLRLPTSSSSETPRAQLATCCNLLVCCSSAYFDRLMTQPAGGGAFNDDPSADPPEWPVINCHRPEFFNGAHIKWMPGSCTSLCPLDEPKGTRR